jgi:hypothetical protein
MRCASCGVENSEGAKFCEECGTPFVRLCPRLNNHGFYVTRSGLSITRIAIPVLGGDDLHYSYRLPVNQEIGGACSHSGRYRGGLHEDH